MMDGPIPRRGNGTDGGRFLSTSRTLRSGATWDSVGGGSVVSKTKHRSNPLSGNRALPSTDAKPVKAT